MGLTNAERQARWRQRHIAATSTEIWKVANYLMDEFDLDDLRKLRRWLNNHIKNPNRSQEERDLDYSRFLSAEGQWLSKKQALTYLANRKRKAAE